LLAFEIAQLLIKQGELVAFLGLMDTEYPRQTFVATFQRIRSANHPTLALGRIFLKKLVDIASLLVESVTKMSGNRNNTLVENAGSHRHDDSNMAPERMKSQTRKLINRAAMKYRPKAYRGDITLFYTGALEGRYGWHLAAKGGFKPIQIPTRADEYLPHLMSMPLVDELAREMKQVFKKSALG
jgi:thioesterase domain-containing protein